MTSTNESMPLFIAGPCVAESFDLLDEVAGHFKALSTELGFRYVFKASFDKANRSSISSYRGPGMKKACQWFSDLKEKHAVEVITDIHLPDQAGELAEVCDILQIPAFLCRQTDLLVAAAETGRTVNVKKGQFMPPASMANVVEKVKMAAEQKGHSAKVMLTERGFSFGYGDLVVDMRSFAVMAKNKVPIIFDVTHSTQQPPASEKSSVSGANRCYAPLLSRSAAATGYVDGFFLESHPNPKEAKSDAASQLSLGQATELIKGVLPLLKEAKNQVINDQNYLD